MGDLCKNTDVIDTSSLLRRGLLIGINYTGTSSALSGCINDTENLEGFLNKNKYLNDDEMVMMNDFKGSDLYPSKANIMLQLGKLVDYANGSDKQVLLFVSYSGHGSYVRDYSGDERDGRDEVLCPIDYSSSGYITDDYIKKNFVDKLNENVRLVMLIDSCHSGSVVDFKYHYSNLNKCIINTKVGDTRCNAVMISGARDQESSIDAYLPDTETGKYEAQGAMTAAFIKHYKDGMSYKTLITSMRKWLKRMKFSQVPQLSSGKELNINDATLLSFFDE